jgi:ABC-type Mn2+/Zn2+ transport system ATPase subunit
MFINFCKIKYPKANTNLLILDEVSSGLDGATENILFTLLKEMALKDNKCIIVISHNLDLNIENINYLYDVKFQGGFSTLIEKEL